MFIREMRVSSKALQSSLTKLISREVFFTGSLVLTMEKLSDVPKSIYKIIDKQIHVDK